MQLEHHTFSDPLRLFDEVYSLGSHRAVLGLGDGVSFESQIPCHDRILETGKEHRAARITLTAGASPQLVVQTLSVMPSGPDDTEPTQLHHFLSRGSVVCGTAEPDVGATAGHLSGDGHRVPRARLGDDLRLLGVVLRVEHHRRHTCLVEEVRQLFGLGDVVRADQDRLSGLVHLFDVADDRLDLVRLGVVHAVGFIDPDVRGVRRDLRHEQVVELPELLARGQCGAGHAAHRGVPSDQGLHRDRVDDLAGIGLAEPLFDLHRGLNAVGPALQLRDTATRGVDQVYATVADDVMNVPLEQIVGVHGDVDVHQGGADVVLVVEVDTTELFLDEGRALLGEGHVSPLGVDLVVLVLHACDHIVDGLIGYLGFGGPGQHQRDERLVDQHRVRLVDDRHVGFRRHQVIRRQCELVAEHVESDLVDRTVGDVGGVGGLAFLVIGVLRDRPGHQTERREQGRHPLRVTGREVVVDREHMHSMALQNMPDGSDRTGQCLAFTGGHLDHVALEQPQRAL